MKHEERIFQAVADIGNAVEGMANDFGSLAQVIADHGKMMQERKEEPAPAPVVNVAAPVVTVQPPVIPPASVNVTQNKMAKGFSGEIVRNDGSKSKFKVTFDF